MSVRVIRTLTPHERAVFEYMQAQEAKHTATIDYIAMMSDIELEEETYESEISEG